MSWKSGASDASKGNGPKTNHTSSTERENYNTGYSWWKKNNGK